MPRWGGTLGDEFVQSDSVVKMAGLEGRDGNAEETWDSMSPGCLRDLDAEGDGTRDQEADVLELP